MWSQKYTSRQYQWLTYNWVPMFYQGMPLVCHSLHHLLNDWHHQYILFCLHIIAGSLIVLFCVVLDVKLLECVSVFYDTLHYLRAILPFHRKTVHLSIWYHKFWNSETILLMLGGLHVLQRYQHTEILHLMYEGLAIFFF